MRTFFRENAAAIRYELWSNYWFSRCKLAAATADAALACAEYARWRGRTPDSRLVAWCGRRLLGLGRCLMPAILRPLAEIASRA